MKKLMAVLGLCASIAVCALVFRPQKAQAHQPPIYRCVFTIYAPACWNGGTFHYTASWCNIVPGFTYTTDVDLGDWIEVGLKGICYCGAGGSTQVGLQGEQVSTDGGQTWGWSILPNVPIVMSACSLDSSFYVPLTGVQLLGGEIVNFTCGGQGLSCGSTGGQ